MLSLVDMCFKLRLKCYDDVLAELKRASCTADIFFSNRKETLFYAVVEFVLSHPKLAYAVLGVNQTIEI